MWNFYNGLIIKQPSSNYQPQQPSTRNKPQQPVIKISAGAVDTTKVYNPKIKK